MQTLAKSAPLGTLGLPAGDHLVIFHVEADTISYEVAKSQHNAPELLEKGKRQPTGFVKKWGGTARKIEDSTDDWLTHINNKHLR